MTIPVPLCKLEHRTYRLIVHIEQKQFARQKSSLNCLRSIQVVYRTRLYVFVLNKPYVIITNIDVTDGLANGATGTLSHVELGEDNKVKRVSVIFYPKMPDDAKTDYGTS